MARVYVVKHKLIGLLRVIPVGLFSERLLKITHHFTNYPCYTYRRLTKLACPCTSLLSLAENQNLTPCRGKLAE